MWGSRKLEVSLEKKREVLFSPVLVLQHLDAIVEHAMLHFSRTEQRVAHSRAEEARCTSSTCASILESGDLI